ncbi:hypothetical protein BJX63DRAFT_417012 [Aspergillus granulosus]|uniref:Uncharacterized protein n=1 Tax=Aspergillus granulosus TaxID=176169 RepID=A0ABR4GR85_9EURO
MAPPPDSLTSLQALRDAARKHSHQAPEISLPERPRKFQNDSYSDAAIAVVGVYTAHLYSEHGSWSTESNRLRQDIMAVDMKIGKVDQKVDRFEHETKEALTELSNRLDDVEEEVKELRKEVKDVQSQLKDVQSQVKDVQSQVKDVQSQFKSFQQEVNSQFKEVNSQFADVRSQFADLQSTIQNTKAVQLNTYRKLLDESIEPVSVLVSLHGKQVFSVAPDFPQTVRDFWKLTSNIPALVRLAKHYSVTGWERWQRSTSDTTDRTEYADLDLAVADHPQRCLTNLSSKWGLQYTSLQRPRKRSRDSGSDGLESRQQLKMRRISGSDICESVFSRNKAGELVRQDQITRLRPPRPVPSSSIVTRVYEKYAGAPGRFSSFESAELGWDANMTIDSPSGSEKSDHS